MVLVYFSPVRWASIAQRPHFFVKEALEYGFDKVIWIEPTASRLPQINDLKTKLRSIEADSFDKPDALTVVTTKLLPIEPLGKLYDIINANKINKLIERIKFEINGAPATFVAGKPSRLSLKVINILNFDCSIFDVMDDYQHFFSGISAINIAKNMREMISKVDICCFSSHGLLDKYSEMARESLLILNACDEGFLINCKKIKNKDEGRYKVYGYVGSIASWFDWDAVIKLASDNPNDKLILVGPNYSMLPSTIPSNIEIRAAIAHKDIPALMSTFDYGLIPFKVNELTDCVDPVKYYEYSAYGLKIISTHFGEMKYRLLNNKVYSFANYKDNYECYPEGVVTWKERFSTLFEFIATKTRH